MNVLQPWNNVICLRPFRLHQRNHTDANCNSLLFAHRIKGQCPTLRVYGSKAARSRLRYPSLAFQQLVASVGKCKSRVVKAWMR